MVVTFAGILKNCGGDCGFEADLKFTELNRIIGQIGWITNAGKTEKSVLNTVTASDDNLELDANDDMDAVMTAVLKLGYDYPKLTA